MTIDNETILKVARQVISIRGHYDETGSTPEELITFANRIAALQREECADAARVYLGRTTTGYYHIDGVCDAIRSQS